jgi:uncharacterized short protein YbdD (DUF466 family)
VLSWGLLSFSLIKSFKTVWAKIRQLSGDDAYERYLKHYAEHQAEKLAEGSEEVVPPLTKEQFFKEWQDGKWNGVKRCC